ncbi:hypothetical protein AAHA92_17295 [Salvia divinorum]|uniref:Uncharacterized protein n=1 Tax=Salvia divinorum TaxID=28513 RepID=A0ABD1H2D7_SALDI
MSTPPVMGRIMGSCREYNPRCIGQGQSILFYTALPLTAFGMSGHMTCWNLFMAEQFIRVEGEDEDGILRDPKELFEVNRPQVYVIPHIKSLRCLDKAAVVIPTKPLEET